MEFHQIDCFNINVKFWKVLGIYTKQNPFRFYKIYSTIIVLTLLISYDVINTVNIFFLPSQLDLFVEELMFLCMELATASKVITFLCFPNKITKIMDDLENPIFNEAVDEELKIIYGAKRFIKRYWKIVTVVSLTSHISNTCLPLIVHLFVPVTLMLPISSYSFLSENTTQRFFYPLYFYQAIGIHYHLWCNVNIDTFFLGLMILIIAQLEILDLKLRTVTDTKKNQGNEEGNTFEAQANLVLELNKCIIHFDEVGKICSLVEEIFSVTLFMQFSMASCIICVILFRFTLPASTGYFIFLGTYLFVMTVQILLPCWFGTRIMDKSVLLTVAVYNCDWTSTSRQFKSNLRLFVERANKPLSITGWKMFSLSLTTFTSIMNSSYSFFTLLRHMQSRDE